jgi:hypothetical protein
MWEYLNLKRFGERFVVPPLSHLNWRNVGIYRAWPGE